MQDKLTNFTTVGHRDHAQRTNGSKVRVGPRPHVKTRPEIHLNKQGARVESMVITCCCGEQITIVCDYDETGQ